MCGTAERMSLGEIMRALGCAPPYVDSAGQPIRSTLLWKKFYTPFSAMSGSRACGPLNARPRSIGYSRGAGDPTAAQQGFGPATPCASHIGTTHGPRA